LVHATERREPVGALDRDRDDPATRLQRDVLATARERWPAKGSSVAGVKIRTRASPPCSAGSTKTVSERFSSRAIRCIAGASNREPSLKTASWLPSSGVSVKTSRTE
jgi:hypothetical protein